MSSLREKCPNTKFYRDTEDLSVFSPNAGKYGLEKTPYLDTFYAVVASRQFWLGLNNKPWKGSPI